MTWRDEIAATEGERAARQYPPDGATGREIAEAARSAARMRRKAGIPDDPDGDDGE